MLQLDTCAEGKLLFEQSATNQNRIDSDSHLDGEKKN